MSDRPDDRRQALWALVLLVPAASIGTYLGMYQPFGPAGLPIFIFCKVWILALPALWTWRIDRQPLKVPPLRRNGMVAGVVTGLAIFGIIAAAYFLVGRHWIDVPAMRSRAAEVKLNQPLVYVVGALYWCFINALLEEYVWRWFVFSKLRMLMSGALAVIVCALLFTAHHIIALAAYFDWRVTVLASLGVFIGGCVWSAMYLRYRNIWSPYVSHILADAVIFVIGYQLIFG